MSFDWVRDLFCVGFDFVSDNNRTRRMDMLEQTQQTEDNAKRAAILNEIKNLLAPANFENEGEIVVTQTQKSDDEEAYGSGTTTSAGTTYPLAVVEGSLADIRKADDVEGGFLTRDELAEHILAKALTKTTFDKLGSRNFSLGTFECLMLDDNGQKLAFNLTISL